MSFSKKATKLIVKNADFFSCSNYIIENNLVTLTGAAEKINECLCSHILAELVKIISPSKSSAVNSFETFYDRYISHSSYTEIELAQLHSLAERICDIGKTYFHPNEDSLAFLLHIKYFVLRIFHDNEKHSWENLSSDIIHGKLSTGDCITSYFNNPRSMHCFFKYLRQYSLPSIVYTQDNNIYLSKDCFSSNHILLLYIAPLIDLGSYLTFNNFLTFSILAIDNPFLGSQNLYNRFPSNILRTLFGAKDRQS